MGQLSKDILIVWLILLFSRAYAAQLTKDGIGSCSAYPRTVYRAFNYRPFCGTLAPSENIPWTYQNVCNTALARFRTVPDTFALYDQTGLRYPDAYPIAAGVALCMCYAIGEVQPATGQAKQANFCTSVGPSGAEQLSGGGYAAGTYEFGSKALPQCFDINLASATVSIASEASLAASTITLPDAALATGSSKPKQTQYSSADTSLSVSIRSLVTTVCTSIVIGFVGPTL